MYLVIKNHKYVYQVQSVAQIFFQNETFINSSSTENEGYTLSSSLYDGYIVSELYYDKKNVSKSSKIVFQSKTDTDISYNVKVSVFLLLRGYFGYYPEYGMLTGIRPTKLIKNLLNTEENASDVKKILINKYFVSEEKADFLIKVSDNESRILSQIDCSKNGLYIGIPFCPSICAYCSFTSFSMKKYKDNGLMAIYVDKLIEEIIYVSKNSKNDIENIYIGGGTPTSLNDELLEKLLIAINSSFDINKIKEFTLECGRVDTITYENLLIMKKYNVKRISINVQSTSNKTLEINNRTHKKEDFLKTYNIAKEVGFENINVDIIVGLLGDSESDIYKTVEDVLELEPDNITLHTLAIKKGSIYKSKLGDFDFINDKDLKNILSNCYAMLYKSDYIPYYMYRQKNMIGNLENTGFSKINKESLYNVSMILEAQSIIGTGAGSASKFVFDNSVTRTYNLKGVEEYIKNFDIILDRKKLFF